MATKKPSTQVTAKQSSKKASTPADAVALTLKVDQKTYVRLCTHGAKQRQTNQHILNEALQEYLKRMNA